MKNEMKMILPKFVLKDAWGLIDASESLSFKNGCLNQDHDLLTINRAYIYCISK